MMSTVHKISRFFVDAVAVAIFGYRASLARYSSVTHDNFLAVEIDDSDSDINNANERFAYNNKVNNKLTSVSHFAIVVMSVRFIIYSSECRSVIDCHQLNLHGKNSHLHLCILLRILCYKQTSFDNFSAANPL